jgi:hypothetical protein
MSLSTITICTLTKAIAVAAAAAAVAVPTTQASVSSASVYGTLDPWAYNVIQPGGASMPLRTEHSAGQNATTQPHADGNGQLDSWARNAIRDAGVSIQLITEHSAGQKQQSGVHSTAAAAFDEQASVRNTFDWRDAGIGAACALLGLVLLAGAAMLALRRRHALAHLQV